MRAEISDMRGLMVTKADLHAEVHSLRADVASDLRVMRKELGEQISGCAGRSSNITRR